MGNGRNGHCTTYIQGASTSNQRIESVWAHLRKQCIEHWINIFCDLEENGNFLGDFVDRNIAQFCFLAIIQVNASGFLVLIIICIIIIILLL